MCLQLPNTVHLMHDRKHSQRHPAFTKHIPLLAKSPSSPRKGWSKPRRRTLSHQAQVWAQHIISTCTVWVHEARNTAPDIRFSWDTRNIMITWRVAAIFTSCSEYFSKFVIVLTFFLLFVHLASFSVSDWIAEMSAFSNIMELNGS